MSFRALSLIFSVHVDTYVDVFYQKLIGGHYCLPWWSLMPQNEWILAIFLTSECKLKWNIFKCFLKKRWTLKALPHVTISSSISSTFHRRRWNIVDIVDDEPTTRNDNVNDADVK